MGVNGLIPFITKHFQKPGSLLTAIKKWQQQNQTDKCCLLVDVSSLIKALLKHNNSLLRTTLATYDIVSTKLESLHENFKQVGIELVYFFDSGSGDVYEDLKREEIIGRKILSLATLVEINKYLTYESSSEGDINKDRFTSHPEIALQIEMTILKLNAKIIIGKHDSDIEIIKLLHQNPTVFFGVISDDADFLVANQVNLICLNSLRYPQGDIECFIINSSDLVSICKFKSYNRLIDFAVLLGNDLTFHLPVLESIQNQIIRKSKSKQLVSGLIEFLNDPIFNLREDYDVFSNSLFEDVMKECPEFQLAIDISRCIYKGQNLNLIVTANGRQLDKSLSRERTDLEDLIQKRRIPRKTIPVLVSSKKISDIYMETIHHSIPPVTLVSQRLTCALYLVLGFNKWDPLAADTSVVDWSHYSGRKMKEFRRQDADYTEFEVTPNEVLPNYIYHVLHYFDLDEPRIIDQFELGGTPFLYWLDAILDHETSVRIRLSLVSFTISDFTFVHCVEDKSSPLPAAPPLPPPSSVAAQ